MFRFAAPHTLGLFAVAGAASLWAVAGGPAAHPGPPASCQALGAVSVQNSEGGTSCSANSAAAANGLDGRATAGAAPTSPSLATAQNRGTAASASQFLSGPAAIAAGPDAQTTVIGARPGLSIGIAGPGATVTVTGTSTPRLHRWPRLRRRLPDPAGLRIHRLSAERGKGGQGRGRDRPGRRSGGRVHRRHGGPGRSGSGWQLCAVGIRATDRDPRTTIGVSIGTTHPATWRRWGG